MPALTAFSSGTTELPYGMVARRDGRCRRYWSCRGIQSVRWGRVFVTLPRVFDAHGEIDVDGAPNLMSRLEEARDAGLAAWWRARIQLHHDDS